METITNAMPNDALVKVIEKIGDFHVGVSWKLNDDPERPNKMSKTILIIVSHEAAEDYSSAMSHDQEKAFERLDSFLSQKLSSFDPTHNARRNEPSPVEKWIITSDIFIG